MSSVLRPACKGLVPDPGECCLFWVCLSWHGLRARVGVELVAGNGRMRHVLVVSSVLFELSCLLSV
jgi:hypothetical protein